MLMLWSLCVTVSLFQAVKTQKNPYENPYICGLPSCAGNEKFKYVPNTQYNYKYSVEVSSLFNGTSRNESTLFLEGDVSLTFPSPCEGLLSLYGFKLKEKSSDIYETPNSDLFGNSLSYSSIKFAFKDGNIYELCPSEAETAWVLNFKKGILNMLHNTMKRFDLDFTTEEDDLRGTCPTQYNVIGAKETSLIIEKTKDLNACQRIGHIHSFVQSTSIPHYSMNARKEKILKSSSKCVLSIDHNIYNQIVCEESHIVQPFSNQEAGATTFIKQSLVLSDESQIQPDDEEQEITRRLSLRFDHRISIKPTTDETEIIDAVLRELCKYDKMQTEMDLSDRFSKLIYNLKTVSYPALSKFYQHIGAVCSTARKHILNALPFVNTGPSVLLMKDIILKKSVSDDTVKDWVASIAFISDPDRDTLAAAGDLMQTTPFNNHIVLGMSSLIHTYCSVHSKCLDDNESVYSSVIFLERTIRESYHKDVKEKNTHNKFVVALKALSNIGRISEEFYAELHHIIEDSQLDPALRVAAVEVFHRLPCEDSRPYFKTLFENVDEDVEVRIASYLQMMKCPDYMLIRSIRQSLLHEEVNQVGSFVWTHLNNLIKTAFPTKVEIQSLLSESDLVKKFSNDVRKFSRNFEGSTYFDEYGVGGNYESNVIFSPSSYIPKSAMLNLSTVLFGESVNLLEVYGRINGFEHYLESFFGPKGTAKDFKEDVMDHLHMKRSLSKNDILKEQVKNVPNVLANDSQEPKISLGMKIFGNNLKYISLNGKTEITEAAQNLNPIYNLEKILSGKEITYNKAVMFLDSKYIVSTGAGLPLSLSATGTAMVNLKLYGSLTYSKITQDKDLELDLVANIDPTVSLDITGEMGVDAFFSSTGIKLKANMMTDTAIKSNIKIRGTQLVSARFSLPKKNNEIINARSELIVKQNNKEELQEGMTNNRISKKICSWESVEKTVGLKLCSSYSLVNVSKMENVPYLIMTGPTSFRFFIHKADPTANGYFFEYKKTATAMTAIFDTSGSQVKRILDASLTAGKGAQNLTLVLQSSEGTILIKGKVINRPDNKVLQCTLSINGKEHIAAGASLSRTFHRNRISYKPSVFISVNKEPIFTFKGSIDLLSKRGTSQYTVDLFFDTKRLHSKLFGYILITENSLEVNLYSDYKFHRTKEQRLSINFRVTNRSPTNMVVVGGSCNLTSTAYPNLNIESNATFQRSGSHMDLTLHLKQAPFPSEHPEADFRTLTFKSIISYKSYTDNKRTWKAEAALVKRSSNLDLKGEFIYETFRHNINIISEVRYGNDKKLSTTVFWSRPKQTLEDIKLHVNVSVPNFNLLILKIVILEKQPRAYMIDFDGTWFSGHSMKAHAFYIDKSTSVSSFHHVKLLLQSPSFKDTNVQYSYYRGNKSFKLLLEANYDSKDQYHIFVLQKIISNEETYIESSVKYKLQLYKFVSTIYDGDYKKINADIHFDQYRDVSIWCYLLNQENNKTLSLNFNWDANRDPNNKLLLTANYKKLSNYNYMADLIVSYPGRTVKGDYTFLLQKGHLNTLISLSWDEGKTAGLKLDLHYEFENNLYLSINSHIYTPIVNWKITKIDGTFKHAGSKYDVHGLVSWDRAHKIGLDFSGDYLSKEEYFWCRYNFSIDSSTEPIPNVNIVIYNFRNASKLDTNLYLMYNPEFVVAVDSYWKIDSDESYLNLTGTIKTKTPFQGLTNGALDSKITLKNNRYLKGEAVFDLNYKKVSINMEGKFRKITDCMLVVNATSLDDNYQLKFLISTEQRHFVAMVTYPDGNLGTEILLSLTSIINFNVKLQLATPIEFLRNVLVVAKLKPEQADFRLSWNFLTLGFSGMWHYEGLTDFEYTYKIYTPLTNFKENGVVAKLIVDEGIDFEVSIQLSIHKLGLKLFGKEESHLVDDTASWKGAIDLDIIIYPTLKGFLEINQKGETYYLQSKLTLPNGIADFRNEFYYHDTLCMRNKLHITTPFVMFNTINSNFELDIKSGRKYILSLNMEYKNHTDLVNIGADIRYEAEIQKLYDKSYNLSVRIETPFKSFRKLNFMGTYENKENFYLAKVLFSTVSTDISVDATSEIINGVLEISANCLIITPSIHIPRSTLQVRKLFSPTNNFMEIDLYSPEMYSSNITLQASWLIKSKTDFTTSVQVVTPFGGLENTTAGIKVYISNTRSTLWATLQMNPIEFETNSTLHNNLLLSGSNLVLKGKKYPINLKCRIIEPGKNKRKFDGTLSVSGELYNISGNADIIGGLYTSFQLKLTPGDNHLPIIFEYHIDQKSLKEYDIIGYIQYLGKVDRFKANLIAQHLLNFKFNLEITTSKLDKFLISSVITSNDKVVNVIVKANTPISQLEHISLSGNLNSTGIDKTITGYLEAGEIKVGGDVQYRWKFLEDMLIIGSGSATNSVFNKTSRIYGLYVNPKQTFDYLCVAADVDIDTWNIGMNTTLRHPKNTTVVSVIALDGNFKIPSENGEVHSFDSYLDYTQKMKHMNYLLKYKSTYFMKKYGLWGLVNIESTRNLTGTVNLEWESSVYRNYGNMKMIQNDIDLIYKLQTPKFGDKQFLVTNIKYAPQKERFNVTLEAFHPEDNRVFHSTVDFSELINMKGYVNVTVPIAINYTGIDFNVETNDMIINRYLKVFWKGNDALLDSKCNIRRGQQLTDSSRMGTLILEIPLKSRHITIVDYKYHETGQLSEGSALAKYNGEKLLEGIYKCVSESMAGLEKDTVHAEIINQYLPIAADYWHKYEYGATEDDDNVDKKHLRIYHKQNQSKFDIMGEIEIHNVWGGQEYILTAKHANKTIKLLSDYTIFDQIFKQHSKLELSPDNWLEYEISVVNKTKDDIFDVQEVILEIIYPKRSFQTKGFYNISESKVITDLLLKWDNDEKTVGGGLDWKKVGPRRNQLTVFLKHPTFEKDVAFRSEYSYGTRHIDGHLIADYSLDPEKTLTIRGKLSDHSDKLSYNFTCDVDAEHNATNLRFESVANIFWNPMLFGNSHITKYKRSYLPESSSETLVKINMKNNEVELKKDIITSGYTYFWGRYGGRYPVYTANMSSVYDNTDKYSGQFFIDFKNSLIYLLMNLTEDGTQSLHMNGIIPDARSALFDIWREYDQIIVSDVAYYLKLNHSRLVTSRLKWRSDLYEDVQSTVREGIMKLYSDTLEGINNTKHYIKSETMDAMNGIWQNAKPLVQQFLDDLKNLTVIEEDIEEFYVFLNNSYEANDFYIKDIINLTFTIFDDLALKSQLQTLPKILRELYSLMGESGVKIKKSILWAVEEIKIYYNNTTEFIHGLINGDPIEHISSGLEKLLEKYDNFIKNLHIKVLQYMETLWYQTYDLIVEHWHRFLTGLEPTFLKFAHYFESMAWSTGREFLDFLYLRKNEFIESPYFVKFAKLSQDIDKFYKDITGNNTIAALYKYSNVVYDFLKEKYIAVIPFGKELLDVVNEIIDELKQIGEIPSVKFLLHKWFTVYDNLRYYYNYLDMQAKIHKLITIIYKKFTQSSITALDIEDRVRTAKTKFIFEPNDGVMLLEQKLPMSWHAFNETPIFREIPEIKTIYDLKAYFDSSKMTFWEIYYDYKTITNPSNWFPPFTGRAMLIGPKYYVTFDNKFYDFQGSCTYLLTRDFDDGNFTLLLSYDEHKKSNELIIVLEKNIVRVNLLKNHILVGDSEVEYLPVQIGEVYLYRESGIFKMDSSVGFHLECNMKYQICTFEMSGWYSGKTAGLWGTYNNEPSDDLKTLNKSRHADQAMTDFANQWSIDKKCKTKILESPITTTSEEVKALCDEFFISKISHLSDCFKRVPQDYFLSMCLKGTNKQEACMAAVSYINMCSYIHTPLRIPDTCVQCNLFNGTEIQEGDSIRFEGEGVPKHADIVFIVEAKMCNKNLKQHKNFEILVDLIEKELLQNNITKNRYAVVTFGGDGIYNEPRSIVVDGKVFDNSKSILKYVDQVIPGNGSEDIFNAIMFAYDLIFRHEATRSFILLPCSDCNVYNMEHDYATVHQLLSEGAISLHILMNDTFKMQKVDARIPFGIDQSFAYTKRDMRTLTGDQSLKKNIQLPKASLGQCLSLALETNGTVFSSKFLETEKKNAKKFVTVYSQIIARSTVPSHCMDCECTATEEGIPYMECYLCTMTSTSKNNVEMLMTYEGDDLTSINLFEEFNSNK